MSDQWIWDAGPDFAFSTAYFEFVGYGGEIDEEGIVDIEVPCSCGHITVLSMTADQLNTIAKQAKLFYDKRKAREE